MNVYEFITYIIPECPMPFTCSIIIEDILDTIDYKINKADQIMEDIDEFYILSENDALDYLSTDLRDIHRRHTIRDIEWAEYVPELDEDIIALYLSIHEDADNAYLVF